MRENKPIKITLIAIFEKKIQIKLHPQILHNTANYEKNKQT